MLGAIVVLVFGSFLFLSHMLRRPWIAVPIKTDHYQVLDYVGPMAYQLALPSSFIVHPVFHVSQLLRSHGVALVSTDLPSMSLEFHVPEFVLQCWWTSCTHAVEQVLFKWSHMPMSLANWENLDQHGRLFPHAPTWRHASYQEVGIFSNDHHQAEDTVVVHGPARSSELSVLLNKWADLFARIIQTLAL